MPKVPTQQDPTKVQQDSERLIKHNGALVEELRETEVWKEIILPLFEESVASVSGRFTGNRFYNGDLTRTNTNRDFLAGYQRGLSDLYNRLDDFVEARKNLIKAKKQDALSAKQPMVNPFMEDEA